MAKVESNDLVTPTQAARLRNVTLQAIMNLIYRERLIPIEIAGQKFLRTSDVLSYQPSKGGRPKKEEVPAVVAKPVEKKVNKRGKSK